jgi:hypothetical protein
VFRNAAYGQIPAELLIFHINCQEASKSPKLRIFILEKKR